MPWQCGEGAPIWEMDRVSVAFWRKGMTVRSWLSSVLESFPVHKGHFHALKERVQLFFPLWSKDAVYLISTSPEHADSVEPTFPATPNDETCNLILTQSTSLCLGHVPTVPVDCRAPTIPIHREQVQTRQSDPPEPARASTKGEKRKRLVVCVRGSRGSAGPVGPRRIVGESDCSPNATDRPWLAFLGVLPPQSQALSCAFVRVRSITVPLSTADQWLRFAHAIPKKRNHRSACVSPLPHHALAATISPSRVSRVLSSDYSL